MSDKYTDKFLDEADKAFKELKVRRLLTKDEIADVKAALDAKDNDKLFELLGYYSRRLNPESAGEIPNIFKI